VDPGNDPSQPEKYTKKFRDLINYKPGPSSALSWRPNDKRTLEIRKLATTAKAANSAEFGVTMIDGAEKVRFIKSAG
jgi:hypothetical protein